MAIELESEGGRGVGRSQLVNPRILCSRFALASFDREKAVVAEIRACRLGGDVVVAIVRCRDLKREELYVVVGVVLGFGAREEEGLAI